MQPLLFSLERAFKKPGLLREKRALCVKKRRFFTVFDEV
jgi:hypothetical protein